LFLGLYQPGGITRTLHGETNPISPFRRSPLSGSIPAFLTKRTQFCLPLFAAQSLLRAKNARKKLKIAVAASRSGL